eukprot:scaffold7912_cov49-Attheya_sp.AAC.1
MKFLLSTAAAIALFAADSSAFAPAKGRVATFGVSSRANGASFLLLFVHTLRYWSLIWGDPPYIRRDDAMQLIHVEQEHSHVESWQSENVCILISPFLRMHFILRGMNDRNEFGTSTWARPGINSCLLE